VREHEVSTVPVPRGLAGDFRDLGRLTRAQEVTNLAFLLSAFGLSAGAVAAFWSTRNPLVFVVAFVVVSSRQQALLNIEHDCSHGSFLSNRRWNHLVGLGLAAGPVGSPYRSARAHHMAHHRLLGTQEDPDGFLHKGAFMDSVAGLVRHFGVALAGGYALSVLVARPTGPQGSASDRRVDLAAIGAAQLVIASIFWFTTAWWAYIALWALPLATLTAACHLLRNFGEHALTPDELATSTNRLITTRSNPVERFIVAPFNMHLHAEHHVFPWIPAPNLPAARARLADHVGAPAILTRRSYLGALVENARAAR